MKFFFSIDRALFIMYFHIETHKSRQAKNRISIHVVYSERLFDNYINFAKYMFW